MIIWFFFIVRISGCSAKTWASSITTRVKDYGFGIYMSG